MLAKGRNLLQILLKALHIPLTIFYWRDSKMAFNLFQPRSICFNLGQFVVVFWVANKKIFLAPSILSSSSFFSSSLLTSLTTPSLLSQHLSPYSFYLNAYLVSLEPQTFGFPLDSYLTSEPWRLGCKFHNCLYYIYIVAVINFLNPLMPNSDL